MPELEPEAKCGAPARGGGGPGVTFDPELGGGGSAGATSDTRVDGGGGGGGGVAAGAAERVDVSTLSAEADGRHLLVPHPAPLRPPRTVG